MLHIHPEVPGRRSSRRPRGHLAALAFLAPLAVGGAAWPAHADGAAAGPEKCSATASAAVSAPQCSLVVDGLGSRLSDVALDGDGHAYVADGSDAGLIKIDTADGAETTVARFRKGVQPHGIALDGSGDAYIVGNSRKGSLLRVDLDSGDTQTVATGLAGAAGIALDGSGGAYVADPGAGRLIRIDLSSGTQTPVLTGAAVVAVALDGQGDAYVVDTSGQFSKVDLASGAATRIGAPLPDPSGLTVDSRGDIFATTPDDGGELIQVDRDSGEATVVATGLGDPTGVTVDPRGDAYVADQSRGGLWRVEDAIGTAAAENPTAENPATGNQGGPLDVSAR